MRELQETELWENSAHVYGRDKETEKREGGLSPISWLFISVGVMGEFIVRALFLAHKLLLVSFLSFF